jgi:hypothetical protein
MRKEPFQSDPRAKAAIPAATAAAEHAGIPQQLHLLSITWRASLVTTLIFHITSLAFKGHTPIHDLLVPFNSYEKGRLITWARVLQPTVLFTALRIPEASHQAQSSLGDMDS